MNVLRAFFCCFFVSVSCALLVFYRRCSGKSNSLSSVKIQDFFQCLSRYYGSTKEPGESIWRDHQSESECDEGTVIVYGAKWMNVLWRDQQSKSEWDEGTVIVCRAKWMNVLWRDQQSKSEWDEGTVIMCWIMTSPVWIREDRIYSQSGPLVIKGDLRDTSST